MLLSLDAGYKLETSERLVSFLRSIRVCNFLLLCLSVITDGHTSLMA